MSDELRQYLAEQEREAREGAADPTTPATYGSYADPRLNSDSEAPTTRSVLARMDAQQAAEQRKPYEAMKNLAVTMMGPFTAGAAAANNYRNVGKAIQRHVAQERKEGNWQMAPVPLSIYGGVFGSLGPLAYTLAANSPGWQSWAGAAGAAGAGATALAAKMGLHEHSLSTARILRHLNRTDPVGRTLYADGGTAHLRQYLEEQGVTVPEGWDGGHTTGDVKRKMGTGWVTGPSVLPPLPKRPQGEIKNLPDRPKPETQERIAEGISPVGNMFTPAREAYQAAQRGDWAGAAEYGGPLALGMALPIPGAKGRPGTLANALSEQAKPTRIDNPIRAYHGSPHDFNEFSLSKIGTGEGAQNEGHGLYFAENEGVAKSYRDTLSTWRNATPDSIPRPSDPIGAAAHDLWIDAGGSLEKAMEWSIMRAGERYTPKQADAIRKQLEKWETEGPPGRMYEVSLHARPEQFLDWDKPLSAQSEAVRGAIAPLYPKTLEPINKSLAASGRPPLAADMSDKAAAFYGNLDTTLGSVHRGNVSGGGAAEALREAGIPGIRYLDQGSRAKALELLKQGKSWDEIKAMPGMTHNKVVWTPEIIEILRKYGIAGPALMGPALAGAFGGSGDENQ